MILLTNETNKDATITANSQLTNYPVSNLVHPFITRVFRTGATTTAEVVFDNLAAVSVDSIAIANHNITSSATTIKLQGNATDVWTSPSVDETLTWDEDIIYKTFTSSSYRYWRIQVVDSTNPDGYIEIGRSWIGLSFTPPGIGPTVTAEYFDESVKSQSIGGQTYGDKRFFRYAFVTNFPAITQSDRALFVAEFDRVGYTTPFFINFNEECSDLTTYYVTLDQESLRFTVLSNNQYYTVSANYLEEV